MKLVYAIPAILFFASVANAETYLGCEMTDAGGYWFKADAACVYEGLGADASTLTAEAPADR